MTHRSRCKMFCTLLLLGFTTAAPETWAQQIGDTSCTSHRPMTPAESALYRRFAAAVALLPAAPAGWAASEPVVPDASEGLCADIDYNREGPMALEAASRYEPALNDEYREKFERRMAGIQARQDDPKYVTQREKLEARQQQLFEEMIKAGQDAAKIGRLTAENEKLQKQSEDLERPLRQQRNEALYRDAQADVSIRLNPNEETCSGQKRALTIPGAIAWLCQIGWNQNSRMDDQSEGASMFNASVLVLFGHWKSEKIDGDLRFTASFDPRHKYTAVQTLRLRISAEPSRAEALLASINTDALRQLLSK